MAALYIIRGVPGSGKTTLGHKLRAGGLVRHVYSADDWMVDEDGGYSFDPRRLSLCHEACRSATESALMDGYGVAVCNTFTRIWEMQPYVDMAKRIGCPMYVIKCEGGFQNVHGVPRAKVDEMRARFEEWLA